ncbi:MAG: hypothetical protein NG747_07550 [Candidatus Brocadia sp.]|nr:hypothetical protein [Candidatus Brocadia sp.]
MSEDGGSSGGHGGPVWLLTYCDLITLLVAFFVMMISFATINVDKYKEDIPKIEESFDPTYWADRFSGVFDEGTMEKNDKPFSGRGGESLLNGGEKPLEALYEKDLEMLEASETERQIETEKPIRSEEMYYYISNFINEGGLAKYIDIEDVRIGCKIKIPVDSCFEKGESTLRKEAHELFGKLGIILRMVRGKIVIDANVRRSLKPNGEFIKKDNLSVDRASNICAFLVTREDIEPQKIAISGYHVVDENEENLINIMIFKK